MRAINASVFLDEQSEPQPDVLMIISPELGGQTGEEGEYFSGGPELVVEIAKSSRRIDLGPKFRDYERAGVVEYLVVTLDPEEIHWFIRREGRFARLSPGPDGVYRSEVFPGLWLDPQRALRRGPAWAHRHARPRLGDPRACGVRRAAGPGGPTRRLKGGREGTTA